MYNKSFSNHRKWSLVENPFFVYMKSRCQLKPKDNYVPVYLDLANDLQYWLFLCVYQRTCAIIFSGELECKAGQQNRWLILGTFASEKREPKKRLTQRPQSILQLPKDLQLHHPALIYSSLDHRCWAPTIVSDEVCKFKDIGEGLPFCVL